MIKAITASILALGLAYGGNVYACGIHSGKPTEASKEMGPAKGKILTASVAIEGMHCGNCANKVKEAVIKLDGVSKVRVSVAKKSMTVTYDEGRISIAQIKAAVSKAGYKPAPKA